MAEGLGRTYGDGEVILRQGEEGTCMYVMQEGRAEVVREDAGGELRLTVLEPGDVFGEMAVFEREVRSATVRALGEARVLTVDRRTLLRRVQEDPSLVLNILRSMGQRVRRLSLELTEARSRPLGGPP